ncbi:unnamed protein product [Closterium sp. Yama58-4]|nr:unnamed protein product [Closterium sp. Yama58-4]
MDSCRGARPSSTATSSRLSAPLLQPTPAQPCPPVTLESSPSAPFVPLSRDSRSWRDRPWRIAFLLLASLALLRLFRLLLPALRASPGPSTSLVAISYARIGVAVVAAAPLVWVPLLYVRRRNSLTMLLPALLALHALLFFLCALLILLFPRIAAAASGAAASSHAPTAISTATAAAVAAARALMTDGVSSVVHTAAAALIPSLTASSGSSPWLLTPSHLASLPLFDYLAPLFSPSLSPNEPAFLTSPFPPTPALASSSGKVIIVCSVSWGEGDTPRVCEAWLLLFVSQLANPPLLLLCVLLVLWAFLASSVLMSLLVAALMGHGVSAEEGDHRHAIHHGAHTVEGSAENGAAAAKLAIAGAGFHSAGATVPTHAVWPVHAPGESFQAGITPQPQFSQLRRQLSLLAQALRLVLTRSLGTAAAVALLIILSYILYLALNTWLAVYVFADLEVPGLLTGSAALLLTVLQVVLLHMLTWFVVPVAAITGKGVCASLATALHLLPAHLLPSLAVFVCARLLLVALGSIARPLLRLLAFVLTPSPLSASHAWVVAASFTRLFLSSVLSTALTTLSLSLLAAVPALYVYLALEERLDAHTGAVLGLQGQEEEVEERGGGRAIEVRVG